MISKRKLCGVAAIGGPIAAILLLTGSPGSKADEMADLRANQELLQKRIDQLSQAPPAAAPFVPGFGPETLSKPTGLPVSGGSFPRSFLIPGTDTSLRIGGFVNANVLWYINGAAQSSQLNGQGGINNQTYFDGQGGTGNLNGIPLNNSINHSRGESFDISPRVSRFLIDARTPSAWGEIKAYIEMDFAYNNTNVNQSGGSASTQAFYTRLRKAYGTFAGFEAGLDNGIMHDPDADPELADFGGGASSNGRGRESQVKYTYAGPYGTVFTVGGENPVPRLQGPFGQVDQDTNQIPGIASCAANGGTGTLTTLTPSSNACLGSAGFFSPLRSTMPEWVATARVNSPWGHMQIGGVVRTDTLDDGQFLERTYLGFGGTISGDVHPFSGAPGALGKDDLGFMTCAGVEMGNQCANGAGVVTNFGAPIVVGGLGPGGTPLLVNPLTNAAWNSAINARVPGGLANGINVRQAYDAAVRSQTPQTYSGQIWYQHWWTENLRSTLEVSGIWNAMNTGIWPQGTANNKLLAISHANLFWSPVAFVDFGLEYAYGHRLTVANFRGDANTVQGEFRVRF
jgi:Porin subfamily/DcaP outer membrane protein